MIVINFGETQINTLVFEKREELLEFFHKLDQFVNHKEEKDYPLFYMMLGPETADEDVRKVSRFLDKMKRDGVDLDTIKRNIEKNRFPLITGGKYEVPVIS